MAFSSFAHIPDLQSLEFAVVLREEGNGEDIVSRMLPMSRIVPGEIKERERPKKTVAPISTKEPCVRPECMANRNRIQEMQDTNDAVREQLEDVEIGIRQLMAKLEGIDKSNKVNDQQNEELEGNLSTLDQQIGLLEIEAEERLQALKSNQNELVFNPRSHKSSSSAYDKVSVRSLDMWDSNWGGSPTKQTEFLASTIRPKTTPGRVFKMPTPKYLEKVQAVGGGGQSRPKSSAGTMRVRKAPMSRPKSQQGTRPKSGGRV
ncbi:hypothetical protein TL16_g07545 [Triparma laevis f. inornata]|uniref:Uncharacterized protein n=1 Tax=Triparma laevis f. inornata TaxID=1714386 RepID=A0A9W7EGE5_9STRA|nr:hypothetical protein TL16_g07545 [Triparma laevis f. inornata]